MPSKKAKVTKKPKGKVVDESEEEEGAVEVEKIPAKGKKPLEIEDEAVGPVGSIDDKDADTLPIGDDEDESVEEVTLDDDELNPFGDKWEQ